jgi:D-alanyl-D-alanine carboxypeptidase/D-alanyl-D-alanine-endopeptidase (penicillin-binding protein 4)
MTLRLALIALLVLGGDPGQGNSGLRSPNPGLQSLQAELSSLLNSPALTRALVGVRIESLRTGEVLFTHNSDKLVVPASNMKLLTMAVAAERLGWQHRFETRLEAAGTVADGVLTGDLFVVGGGDPSIESPDRGHPQLFLDWAEALKRAGIRRVHGRVIGDDSAFDDNGLGAGWAWDYLTDGYAAPSGALSYNENVIAVRVVPGKAEGDSAVVTLLPPGGGQFTVVNTAVTGAAGSNASVSVSRMPGDERLLVSGRVPLGGAGVTRETTVANPTQYFVDALRAALASRGVLVTGGAWDLDELGTPPASGARRLIARRESAPLSLLGANFLKPSQNFYGEMFLKAVGRGTDRPGTAALGRQAARETLGKWGIGADSFVMNDGSGLSRYDYVTADAIVALLKHVWQDERLRGPFLAALPTGGYDGTLGSRMKNTPLAMRVQAKTGTISNMRALSGYLVTDSGERIVFSIIANHFTAGSAAVDEVAEKMLLRLVTR